MHALFLSSTGTPASNSSGTVMLAHQHGPLWLEVPQSWQSFGRLQSGQKSGANWLLTPGLMRAPIVLFGVERRAT
jgi:hypothetical protein